MNIKILVEKNMQKPWIFLIFPVYLSLVCMFLIFFSNSFEETELSHATHLNVSFWLFLVICVFCYLIPSVFFLHAYFHSKKCQWKGYYAVVLFVVVSCMMIFLYYTLGGFTRDTTSYDAECNCGYYKPMYTYANGHVFCGEPFPFICYKLLILVSLLSLSVLSYVEYVRKIKAKQKNLNTCSAKYLVFFFLSYFFFGFLLIFSGFPVMGSIFLLFVVGNQILSIVWRRSSNALFWAFNIISGVVILPLLLLAPFTEHLSIPGGGPVTGFFLLGLFYMFALPVLFLGNIIMTIIHLIIRPRKKEKIS